MERLIGLFVLAFSLSAFAQQGSMESQGHSEERNRPQQQAQAAQHQMQTQRDQGQARTSEQQKQALQQLRNEHDDLSIFVAALQSTGLDDAVAKGEYTAFAPSNQAFEQMDKSVDEMLTPENEEQLVALLRNHLVADQIDAERASKLEKAMTVGGETLTLTESNGELTVNGAAIEETDIHAGALTVHMIDRVLQQDTAAGKTSAMKNREQARAKPKESWATETERSDD
jgi:uncharacterized surface protein with fasciclin (FAS1) repeats